MKRKTGGSFRIASIHLDESAGAARGTDMERERAVAAYDMLAYNNFVPVGSNGGPYALTLAIRENRLIFDIALLDGTHEGRVMLSLSPFRKIIKDYFLICESYHRAVRHEPASTVETLDLGRRGLHNEGAHLLVERLKNKIVVDFDTARRLFTLICALHWRG